MKLDKERAQELVNRINKRKEELDILKATYRDVPDLKELVAIAKESFAKDENTLAFVYSIYRFVAEEYETLSRPSVAAIYRYEALMTAREIFETHDIEFDDLSEMLTRLLKDRNAYIDDDCPDVRELVTGMIKEEIIQKAFDNIMKHRRMLKNDPVEMSEKYLAVIDEVEELIEKNSSMKGMGSCFETWELKGQYLGERGIYWRSPALLNPRMRFD